VRGAPGGFERVALRAWMDGRSRRLDERHWRDAISWVIPREFRSS
jgi:hypothetical protein